MVFNISGLALELKAWSAKSSPHEILPKQFLAHGSAIDVQFSLLSPSQYQRARSTTGAKPPHIVATSIDSFESKLYRYLVSHLQDVTMLHAGAVLVQEQVLIFPACSGSGKSTLVKALCEIGATYLTDEWVFINQLGGLSFYPRALKLKNPARRFILNTLFPPPDTSALTLFTRYAPGADWHPRNLASTEYCLELLKSCPQMRTQPQQTLARVNKFVSRTRALHTDRDDCSKAISNILGLSECSP